MDNLQERIEGVTIEHVDKLLRREIAAKHDPRSEDSLAIWALNRLKSTLVAFNNYCPEMTAFYNGYAQAQADGVQTPLADEDLQICINMQKQLIHDMQARIVEQDVSKDKLIAALMDLYIDIKERQDDGEKYNPGTVFALNNIGAALKEAE